MKHFHELTAAEAVTLYRELRLPDQANAILSNNSDRDLETVAWPWNRGIEPWEHTSYAYGFLHDVDAGDANVALTDARNIISDNSLKNSKLTVSLDYLRIYDYPGRGAHKILLKFNAKNQFATQDEDINFNQTFSIQEGQRAPISGYPIFIGLNTGTELVQFNVDIINVLNENDERFLNVINSGIVTNGLKLLGTVNPVVPIVAEYAKGITEMIASRNKNRPITAPKMGLYFGNSAGRMKLAKGMYVAVQTSTPDQFNWSNWIYNRNFGTIQSIDGGQTELPYNYFAFSISKTN